MAQERILISSDWGKVTAELIDNGATQSLVQILPLTIEMRSKMKKSGRAAYHTHRPHPSESNAVDK